MIFVNNRLERLVGTDGATNIATNAGVCDNCYIYDGLRQCHYHHCLFVLKLQGGRYDISHWSSSLENYVQVKI